MPGHVFETEVLEAFRGLTMKIELWFDNARDRSPCVVIVVFFQHDKQRVACILPVLPIISSDGVQRPWRNPSCP